MTETPGTPPAHFVVIVPGYMGSRLRSRSTGELLWIDLKSLLLRDPLHLDRSITRLFETLTYPNDDIEPAGIMDQVVFAPPLFKQEHYNRLINALVAKGYVLDPTAPAPDTPALYTFAYDWRQDNRISARQLGRAIDGWSAKHPGAKAWVIAHSNGGLVSRWYIEKEGGAAKVGRLFLMASPWDGAPRAAEILHSGLEIAFLRIFNRFDIGKISRDAIRTFPSFYQLIPFKNPFLNDLDNQKVDLFADTRWVENDRHAQLLLDGRRFNQELGNTLSVETLCFFGSRKPTTTAGRVRFMAGGRWGKLEWADTESGDGTVPERSAVHPNAQQKLPFVASHGDIYVIPAVLEKLDWEMNRKYRLGVLAEATVGNFHVQFEPEQDAYAAGEQIGLWATIHELGQDASRTPIFGQAIHAGLFLAQDLAGNPGPDDQPVDSTDLLDSAVEPGRYEGSLLAPATTGYYRLVCTLTLPGQETALQMEELVLVEGDLEVPSEESPFEDFIPKDLDLPMLAVSDEPLREGGFSFGELPTAMFEDSAAFGGADPEVAGGGSTSAGDSTVAGGHEPQAVPAAGLVEEAPADEKRYLNADVLGQPANEPLPADREFTLEIWVDLHPSQIPFQTMFEDTGLFASGETQLALKVLITSTDFNIFTTEPQTLRVPKTGRSKNRVRFDLEPQHSGEGKVKAYILKGNNFVRGMEITFNVGEPANGPAIANIESLGRPMDSAFAIQPRDLSLIIKKETNGFTFTLISATVSEAFLPITPELLNSVVSDARRRMLEVVYLWEDAQGKVNLLPPGTNPVPASIRLAYQSSLKISERVGKEGLLRMAKAGHLLFEQLFYSNAAGPDSIAMGDQLRKLLSSGHNKLQIVSQEFMLPWGMLYLSEGESFDAAAVSSERFVGFRHIVEHIPLQKDSQVTDPLIKSLPVLNLSVNMDEGIDAQFGVEAVKGQLAYFRSLSDQRVKLVERKTAQDFLEAWGDRANSDQILYFYGHAVSKQLAELGGPGGSSLQLSNKTFITLDDLKLRASIRQKLSGAPLIFINACESAELSPLFYDGFMPYFVARGARGMIGTECQVPVRFGDEWARRFFRLFFSGDQTLGEIFLRLRRQFLDEDNNLLGLLYALYCDGDTRVDPGL